MNLFEAQQKVIVLSLEELENLWDAAEFRARSGGQRSERYGGKYVSPSPDFKTYLKEQGIKLTNH